MIFYKIKKPNLEERVYTERELSKQGYEICSADDKLAPYSQCLFVAIESINWDDFFGMRLDAITPQGYIFDNDIIVSSSEMKKHTLVETDLWYVYEAEEIKNWNKYNGGLAVEEFIRMKLNENSITPGEYYKITEIAVKYFGEYVEPNEEIFFREVL